MVNIINIINKLQLKAQVNCLYDMYTIILK